jgi:hypothetical protein
VGAAGTVTWLPPPPPPEDEFDELPETQPVTPAQARTVRLSAQSSNPNEVRMRELNLLLGNESTEFI